MDQNIFVIIGYVGMLFVVVSMMMTKMMYLRIINSIGCALTVLYTIGLMVLTGSFDFIPVLLLNAALLLINVVQLIIYFRQKPVYDIIDEDISGTVVKHFVNRFRKTIMKNSPLFFNRYPDSNYAKVVFCNDTAVGMVIGRRDGDVLQVFADFIQPDYDKPELVNIIRNEVHNDGINQEVYRYIPDALHNKFLKSGCKKVADADFVCELSEIETTI